MIARLVSQSAGVALAASVALCAGAAFAQQAPAGAPPAEGEEAPAAEAPPPPPSHLEACGAARCLTVGMTPELQQALAAGEATLEQIASGLTFTYEGLEPVRVYFVAARYEDDRMVRYDVSEAINIEPGTATIPDAAEVIQHALAPRTESGVTAAAIPQDIAPAAPELPASGFVGSMPANTLMAMVRPDLAEPLAVDVRMGLDEVGVLALITRDAALRENLESKSIGAVIRLNYAD